MNFCSANLKEWVPFPLLCDVIQYFVKVFVSAVRNENTCQY